MKAINYSNSTDKQKAYIEDRINREVRCLDNESIEFILAQGNEEIEDVPFTYDDIQNMYTYTYNGKYVAFDNISDDELQAEIETLGNTINEGIDRGADTDDMQTELNDLENLESEPQEILQWFYISEWLANELNKINEPVIIRNGSPSIWGRTCCGQDVACDYTFWEIFQESLKDIK